MSITSRCPLSFTSQTNKFKSKIMIAGSSSKTKGRSKILGWITTKSSKTKLNTKNKSKFSPRRRKWQIKLSKCTLRASSAGKPPSMMKTDSCTWTPTGSCMRLVKLMRSHSMLNSIGKMRSSHKLRCCSRIKTSNISTWTLKPCAMPIKTSMDSRLTSFHHGKRIGSIFKLLLWVEIGWQLPMSQKSGSLTLLEI